MMLRAPLRGICELPSYPQACEKRLAEALGATP
jgi:hypothetical protein